MLLKIGEKCVFLIFLMLLKNDFIKYKRARILPLVSCDLVTNYHLHRFHNWLYIQLCGFGLHHSD